MEQTNRESTLGCLDDADAQLEAVETLLKVAQEDVLPSYMGGSHSATSKVDTLLLIALDQLRAAQERVKVAIEQAIEKKEEES